MIDKPDPKDAGRTDGPGGKRPHATIDVKATEVKTPPSSATDGGSAASGAASTASASSAASSAKPAGPGPASSSSATPAATGTTPAGAAQGGSSASAASAAKPAAAKAPAPDTAAAPSRVGSFFSHLAGGVLGGGFVYAAAALLAPGWSPQGPDSAQTDIAARVAALEAAPRETANLGEITAKIGDAESRLAKLDQIEQSLAALREAQGKLAAEAKSLAEASTNGDDARSAERLAKLEDQLAMIAAAAPQSDGRVPQIAALSGKISDLESALSTQVASLRKSLPAEVDERLAATAEASEAAKAATTRLDREMAQARTEQARGLQKIEAQKAETDRLAAAVEAVREETGRLSSTVGEVRSSLDSQLKSVARPADVSAAVGPVHSKLAELEQNVQSVVRSEQSRRENAERIVLSLELSNLKRALDRGQGQGYAAELADVRKAGGGQLDLSALERFQESGVATPAQLKSEFRPVMNAVIDADLEPADGSVIDRLLAGAKSVVRVRKISHEAGDTSTEAIVARIESALNDGRLGDVIGQAKTLPQRAQIPIEDWLIKVTARQSVDQAIAQIDDRLKASLSGAPEPADAPAPAPSAAPPPPAQN